MGLFRSQDALKNVQTQGANKARTSKLKSQASAAKAAGRGKRQVIGRAPAPAKTRSGW